MSNAGSMPDVCDQCLGSGWVQYLGNGGDDPTGSRPSVPGVGTCCLSCDGFARWEERELALAEARLQAEDTESHGAGVCPACQGEGWTECRCPHCDITWTDADDLQQVQPDGHYACPTCLHDDLEGTLCSTCGGNGTYLPFPMGGRHDAMFHPFDGCKDRA